MSVEEEEPGRYTCRYVDNPQRTRRIKEETDWECVFCGGTLNLKVAGGTFDDLSAMRALFCERPEDVKHPSGQRIPEKRGGYYYRAKASGPGVTQEVLVRRAENHTTRAAWS